MSLFRDHVIQAQAYFVTDRLPAVPAALAALEVRAVPVVVPDSVALTADALHPALVGK